MRTLIVWIVKLTATALSLSTAVTGTIDDATVAIRACFVPDLPTAARCVSLEVPRDRAHPDGERLRLGAAIVPAVSGRPLPELRIVLADGPGQAASDCGAQVA